MSIGVISSARSTSQPGDGSSPDSGSLGPLDVLASEEVAAVSGPLTYDEALAALDDERRSLTERLHALQDLYEQSQMQLTQAQERCATLASRMREIETALLRTSRQDILTVSRDLGKAEADVARLSAVCDHLKTQIEAAYRAHRNARIALRAVEESAAREASAEQAAVSQAEASSPSLAPADDGMLLAVRDRERQRLAGIIEERLCAVLSQSLAVPGMHASVLRGDPSRALDAAEALRQRLEDTLAEASLLRLELDPVRLGDLGLAATLRQYTRDLAALRGVRIATDIHPLTVSLSPAFERALFRAICAAIDNALRHGHARHIRTTLRQEHRLVILTIQDDGSGGSIDQVEAAIAGGGSGGLAQVACEAERLGAQIGIECGTGGFRLDYVIEVE
jgi:signal transduction histidine kinase